MKFLFLTALTIGSHVILPPTQPSIFLTGSGICLTPLLRSRGYLRCLVALPLVRGQFVRLIKLCFNFVLAPLSVRSRFFNKSVICPVFLFHTFFLSTSQAPQF